MHGWSEGMEKGDWDRDGETSPFPPRGKIFHSLLLSGLWDVLKLIYFWLGFIWHNTISCNELMTGSTYPFRFSIFYFLLCVFFCDRGRGGEGGKKACGPSFFDSLLFFFLGTSDKYKQDLDDLKII